jgi:hypothetical protein
MKKPVGAKEQPKEEKKEVRPVQPPTPVQNPKPAAASAMSDIWEIPAFLRKKRRDNP